jgi:TIR domain
LFAETEFFYYKNPNLKRHYLHIERHGDQYEFDWERKVVEKGPMFMRTTLRLPERTRRELETLQRLELEEEFRRRRKEAEYSTDVFISYASADSSEANQIYDAIVGRDKKAFLAGKSLKPGEDFADEIRQALISSRELWLLVSPASLKSDWVLSEWGAAWALDKKITPILHRCSPENLPDRIRRLQCIDFYKVPELVAQTFPPKEWKITQVFKPENAAKLTELDEFMSWPAHRDSKVGFIFPDPETEKRWLVYCKSYESDDSDPNLRQRHMVLIHIDDVKIRRSEGVY